MFALRAPSGAWIRFCTAFTLGSRAVILVHDAELATWTEDLAYLQLMLGMIGAWYPFEPVEVIFDEG